MTKTDDRVGGTADGAGATALSRPDRVMQVRACTAADEPAILALHERGFGKPWPAALWRWRTTDTPLGTVQAIGAFTPSSECKAIFCGVSLPCRFGGVPALAISGSDSVLDPEYRASLAGARTFERVVQMFFARFGGGSARFMYGSPVSGLLRAMVARMRVEVLCDVDALFRDVGAVAEQRLRPPLRTMPLASLGAEVDDLWLRCRGADADGITRDCAFLDWRFRRHPTVRYELVAARGANGALRGLAVLRDGGWLPDLLSIAEWLVPEDDLDAERALLAHAEMMARSRGARAVVGAFAACTPEFARWQTLHGFHVRPTSHQLAFRSFHHDATRDRLFARWRLTMADLEFL